MSISSLRGSNDEAISNPCVLDCFAIARNDGFTSEISLPLWVNAQTPALVSFLREFPAYRFHQ